MDLNISSNRQSGNTSKNITKTHNYFVLQIFLKHCADCFKDFSESIFTCRKVYPQHTMVQWEVFTVLLTSTESLPIIPHVLAMKQSSCCTVDRRVIRQIDKVSYHEYYDKSMYSTLKFSLRSTFKQWTNLCFPLNNQNGTVGGSQDISLFKEVFFLSYRIMPIGSSKIPLPLYIQPSVLQCKLSCLSCLYLYILSPIF